MLLMRGVKRFVQRRKRQICHQDIKSSAAQMSFAPEKRQKRLHQDDMRDIVSQT
jgi:hypothetical protein